MRRQTFLYHFLFLIFCSISFSSQAQAPSLIEFGKNRVQYKTFNWQFYETENFRIYFYQGGQDLGKYVILNCENILDDLSKKLDFRLQRKLDIIVYNDISDLRQTNIGLETNEPIENGQVKIVDNKLFVYFNGSHKHLDEQIRQGISKVFVSKYVTGAGLRETFRNSIASSLPSWYTDGMVAFNTYGWNTKFENQLKDGILSGKFQDLSKLNDKEMSFVGHSIWAYVNEKYGTDAVANLMYLVKINRSIDRGFSYVTGKNFASFLEEWYYYYLNRFKAEKERYKAVQSDNIVAIPLKKNHLLYGAKLNAKGDKIAYISNEDSKWRVTVFDLKTDEKKVVFRGGFRTNTIKTDLMNPKIAWNPRGDKLTIVYEKRDKYFYRHYLLADKTLEKEVPIRKFENIFDFAYAEDSKHLIFSAMKKGQIDIFRYYMPSTKLTQITNDFYDDLQPSFIEIDGYKGYLFISNRPNNEVKKQKLDSILPNGNFDVYFYDLKNDKQRLVQVTATPYANESYPQAYNGKYYSFLSDANGINNRYIGDFETQRVEDKIQYVFNTKEYPTQNDTLVLKQNEVLDSNMVYGRNLNKVVSKTKVPSYETVGVSYLNSNYNNSIDELSHSPKSEKTLEQLLFNKKQRLLLSTYQSLKNTNVSATEYSKKQSNYLKSLEKINTPKIDSTDQKSLKDSTAKPIIFQSKFDEWTEDKEDGYSQMLQAMKGIKENQGKGYRFSRTRQYFIRFKAEDVNLSLDNKLLISPYQKFNPQSPVYNNNGISGFIKIGTIDLFENHKIHGGFRISDKSILPREYYMTYENLTKRLDHEYTYYRNTILTDINTIEGKQLIRTGKRIQTTNYLHAKLKYPFDVLNSLRLKIAYRNEKTSYKATDEVSLNTQNTINNWGILKLEYVHDNTIKLRANTRQGLRANAYVEFHKEFPGKNVSVFKDNLNLPSWNNGCLVAFGGDVRHYQKVYKTITWANRLAFASSLGTRKVVYYLGGSDGMLFPKIDRTNDVSKDQNYAFQALAQNLRGFMQNTRNGNSYVVLNSEFRVPIFSAFSKSTMRSKLLESIELVAFLDIGTAWEGLTPWSSDNIYTETRYNTPEEPSQSTATVLLNVYKDPIVLGFGPGLRANLFGYFFKLDVGWGYDTGKLSKPRFQVSMTYDF